MTAYRKLQRTQLSGDKTSLDLVYLSTIKVGEVIPNFTYFKSIICNFSDSKRYKSILLKFLNFEIISKQRPLTKLRSQHDNDMRSFKGIVTCLDVKILLSKLTEGNKHKVNIFKQIHSRKLKELRHTPPSGIEAGRVIYSFSERQ